LLLHRPTYGQDLYLSIDVRIQNQVDAVFQNDAGTTQLCGGTQVGSIIVSDPHTGQILAMDSRPFINPTTIGDMDPSQNDPNVTVGAAYWSQISSDPCAPVLSRAVQGQYAPGSIFKQITGSAALQEGGDLARILSGGTDVIVQVREGRRTCGMLIDIKEVPEANQLSFDPDRGLTMGAAAPCYKIYTNETIRRVYPALVDSSSLIGGVQIQSRASLGGNLCNASPAADSIPTLIALEGTCRIEGQQGTRTLAVEEFWVGPGRNVLQAGELLVSFHFPAPRARSGAFFLRFIPRNEMDIAVVNAAANVQLSQRRDTIEWARIAVGAVAPTPLLLTEASEALRGAAATAEGITAAVEEAQIASITAALCRVAGRVAPHARVIAVGVGAFLARAAAERCRLAVHRDAGPLSPLTGKGGEVAAAVALSVLGRE